MKKILVLSTGGTIASDNTEHGLYPKLSIEQILDYTPYVRANFEYDCKSILNLDSSNIQPEEWKIIANAIWANRTFYKAIIVTHGTDTMAYTASMLSFMLITVGIPIVMTGSQLPVSFEGSDAPRNITDAFLLASSDIPPSVYIVFDGKVMLGCRASKVRTISLNAFESINADYFGYFENNQFIPNHIIMEKPLMADRLYLDLSDSVFLLKLIPGTSTDFFDAFLNLGYKALVIEAFGIGGLHYIRRDLLEKIEILIENGIYVIVVSQCTYELSDLTIYEVGQRIAEEGVISGKDMTTESTVTKLMWSLGNHRKLGKSIKEMMMTNYAGEISL